MYSIAKFNMADLRQSYSQEITPIDAIPCMIVMT